MKIEEFYNAGYQIKTLQMADALSTLQLDGVKNAIDLEHARPLHVEYQTEDAPDNMVFMIIDPNGHEIKDFTGDPLHDPVFEDIVTYIENELSI